MGKRERLRIGRPFSGENVTTTYVDVNGDGLIDMLRLPNRTMLGAYQPAISNCLFGVYLELGQGRVREGRPRVRPVQCLWARASGWIGAAAAAGGSGQIVVSYASGVVGWTIWD
jgi:hypothetical protein